jgi:hypothetical protein
MKNQSENLMAAQAAYVAPSVELIEVSVEKGFAQSSVEDDSENAATMTAGSVWGAN